MTILFSAPSSAQIGKDLKQRVKTPLQSLKNASNSAGINETALDNLRNRSLKEIERRISALNELVTKLSSLKRVTSAQKSTLSSLIQNEITNLNSLISRIETDADILTLKTDTKSIVTSHRIFALFMPQIRLLAAADALNNSAMKMSEFATKIETRINEASSSGQSTTELETLLSQMKTNISEAQTQADAVVAAVTPLTPDGYPANRTTLLAAKQNLQAGHQSLKKAAQSARQIIAKLLIMSVGDNSTGENSSSASSMMKPGVVNNLKVR